MDGTVLGDPINSSGLYEIYCNIDQYGYIYYKVDSSGRLNVTSNSMTTYWTVEDNYIQRFENFMRPEDSIRPVLARYLAKNIVASLTNTLKSYTTKFRTFTTSIFQGESLTTLSNWEAIPSPSPTPPTIPTTTESPVFGCLPGKI